MPQECKQNVGRGTVAYPCILPRDHDGPCVALENQVSIANRRRWEADPELWQLQEEENALAKAEFRAPRRLEELRAQLGPLPTPEQVQQPRQVPHPGAEPLTAFQGPGKTSQEGLLEHGQHIPTVDTNQPGAGKSVYTHRPDGTFVQRSTPVPQTFEAAVVQALKSPRRVENVAPPWHPNEEQLREMERALDADIAASKAVPTKQRPGDQPLPVVNDSEFIQDKVIADIEARKAVGIERYGTALQSFNGRNVVQDGYEEALDFTMYWRQLLEERKDLYELVGEVWDELQQILGDVPLGLREKLEIIYAALS